MNLLEQVVLPLSLMPGVGLMIMSTVNLSIYLSQEIQVLLQQTLLEQALTLKKIQQLKRLNQSLFCLYASAGAFLSASISSLFEDLSWLTRWGISMGVLTWLIALVLLIVFASKAIFLFRIK